MPCFQAQLGLYYAMQSLERFFLKNIPKHKQYNLIFIGYCNSKYTIISKQIQGLLGARE